LICGISSLLGGRNGAAVRRSNGRTFDFHLLYDHLVLRHCLAVVVGDAKSRYSQESSKCGTIGAIEADERGKRRTLAN
jgi:hypothetical protein